ncbi:Protein of unknown function [Peptoclostridium litorale DSM 5388]|uniref:Amidohydrolase n=1 Tax=Peptoclostridium litorale DSM 5388 TaxID=1121324 RepID=A0A069RH65_PEPLI|nr:DUF3800 domain-containing protein [Peptoclostridium litorale]KDR95515.1 amidohydrolase [Peptoclostridium litorale DSM 5388]SIO17047.1 Protein of unknown function [Peptoclostridium litorale DSM 5388]
MEKHVKKSKKIKYVIYIDESGVTGGDKGFFAIAACVFNKKYIDELDEKLNAFKIDCFGRKDIILHLKDISEGVNDFSMENGVSSVQLRYFWSKLPEFLYSVNFKIISITVDKEMLYKYFKTPKNVYEVAFGHLFQAVYYILDSEDTESLNIICESRNPNLNFMAQRAFFNIYNSGTPYMDISTQMRKMRSFEYRDKSENIAGLQIADLVCNPLRRVRMGLIEAMPRFVDAYSENSIFKTVKYKLYCPFNDGDFKNWSFKKVPLLEESFSVGK